MLQTLLHHLFPPLCFGCDQEGMYFCKDCLKKIYSNESKTSQYIQDGILNEVIIGFNYSTIIKKCIRGIKYEGTTKCIPILIKKLIYSYDFSLFDKKSTIIVPVPTHWYKKYFIRGYNQSELLALEFSKQETIPYQNIFKKIKWTRSQTKLSRTKRKINIYGSFTLFKPIHELVKTIIIVDDIITTGATTKTLAALIKKRYPNKIVIGLFIARN